MPYVEVPAFIRDLRSQDGSAPRALGFLILTAARTAEVLGAQWQEVDCQSALWVLPAGRTKQGREHRVPLASAAVGVLEGLPRGGDLIFPGRQWTRPLHHEALLRVLRRMGHGSITAHGFRSAFADWAAERTGFSYEVREAALGHVVGGQVERSYRRGDLLEQRRTLMEEWATFEYVNYSCHRWQEKLT